MASPTAWASHMPVQGALVKRFRKRWFLWRGEGVYLGKCVKLRAQVPKTCGFLVDPLLSQPEKGTNLRNEVHAGMH